MSWCVFFISDPVYYYQSWTNEKPEKNKEKNRLSIPTSVLSLSVCSSVLICYSVYVDVYVQDELASSHWVLSNFDLPEEHNF